MVTPKNATVQDSGANLKENYPGSIAQLILWVKISEEYEWTSRFEGKMSQRQAWDIDRVEKLHRVTFTIFSGGRVCRMQNHFLAWKEVQNGLVHVIHSIILCRENGALQEKVISFRAVNARI